MKFMKAASVIITSIFAFAMFAAAVNAEDDPLAKPDWYEGDDWTELEIDEQKAAYDKKIEDYDTTIATLEDTYANVCKELKKAADALKDQIDATEADGKPGAIPEPPSNPDADAVDENGEPIVDEDGNPVKAWNQWQGEIQAWFDAFVAWYNGLTAAQKEALFPLYNTYRAAYNRLMAVHLTRELAKSERDALVKAKDKHCEAADAADGGDDGSGD